MKKFNWKQSENIKETKKMSQQELSDKLEILAIYIAEDLFHELRIKVER